jgi:hypothetical protein
MRRYGLVVLALVAAVGIGACEDDEDEDTVEFRATLLGTNERPTPVTNTSATGTASVIDNGASMSFVVNVNGIANVTAAHIHVASVDSAGPIVVDLTPNTAVTTGILAQGTFTQANIRPLQTGAAPISMDSLRVLMRAGRTYVNVHNTANPGGHIRGQLLLN